MSRQALRRIDHQLVIWFAALVILLLWILALSGCGAAGGPPRGDQCLIYADRVLEDVPATCVSYFMKQ